MDQTPTSQSTAVDPAIPSGPERQPLQIAATSSGDPPKQDPVLLRLALGYVYFHFGFLKFFPDLSPAEWLAEQTVMKLLHQGLNPEHSLHLLAVFECAIGLGLIFKVFPRIISVMFFLHMAGTYLPAIYMPEMLFKIAPFAPTLEGQYIIKNFVFLAAGWTVLVPHAFGNGQRRRNSRETSQPTPP